MTCRVIYGPLQEKQSVRHRVCLRLDLRAVLMCARGPRVMPDRSLPLSCPGLDGKLHGHPNNPALGRACLPEPHTPHQRVIQMLCLRTICPTVLVRFLLPTCQNRWSYCRSPLQLHDTAFSILPWKACDDNETTQGLPANSWAVLPNPSPEHTPLKSDGRTCAPKRHSRCQQAPPTAACKSFFWIGVF